MRTFPSQITTLWKEPAPVEIPQDLLGLSLPDMALRALVRQGMRTAADARAFLDYRLYQPASPYDLPGMDKAIERTLQAIKKGEQVGVWGDFDVDGQTSTAILVSALRKAGAEVCHHIPVRAFESHGIKLEPLTEFLSLGVQLLITCDTGISEMESIAFARQMGVDVIVTDHHSLPETLPPAFALINPQFLDENHPLRPLPGAGVACKYAEAILNAVNQADAASALHDLAALGIVADIAELRADARYLVQSGLELMRRSPRASLRAMLEAAEVEPGQCSEESIAYALAPRMNALGRLGDANPMVDFLLSEDPAVLSVTVNRLEGLNAQRKLRCDQVFHGAMDQIERSPSMLEHPVLMLSHPEWEAGVVGIVASRLVELFHRPVMLFVAPEGGAMRGSARSVEGVNITAAIRAQAELLKSFGGHPMAAGLSLDPKNFARFQRQLDKFVLQELESHPLMHEIQIDDYAQPDQITLSTLQALDQLAPFGAGNPPLTFAARDLRISSLTPIGKTKEHLQVIVEDPRGNLSKFIWWQAAGLPQPEGRFDLAYTARSSTYKGQAQVQLEWLDYRNCEPESQTVITPSAELGDILDYRQNPQPEKALREILRNETALVFKEGSLAFSCEGRTREYLEKNPALVILTAPPSQAVLRDLLDSVRPARIYVFGQVPEENAAEIFLKSLARLVKEGFAQSQKEFKLPTLSAALSSTPQAVLSGLNWFASKGSFTIQKQEGEEIFLDPQGVANPENERLYQARLQKELSEIQSFRRYFRSSSLEPLVARE